MNLFVRLSFYDGRGRPSYGIGCQGEYAMRIVLQITSWIALAATILPSILFLASKLDLEHAQWIMLAATLAWFVATPLWMGRKVERPPGQLIANEE